MGIVLLTFLETLGIDTSKYSETITRAWVLAVRHFMEGSPICTSSDEFIAWNPGILDPKIMLTHYSAETLFSDEARANYVEPHLSRIPQYRA